MTVSKMLSSQLICSIVAATLVGIPRVQAQEFTRGLPPAFSQHLATSKEIYVATVRKDGSRSTPAPVWFGLMEGSIWFTTSPDSWKAKRIRRGSPMFVSVDGKRGPFVQMKAEIILDGDKAEQLGKIYDEKYWIAWLGFFRPSKSRNESGKTILLKLTPASEPQA